MDKQYALVQFVTSMDTETVRVGILSGGIVRDATTALPWRSTLDLLQEWEEASARLRALDLDTLPIAQDARLIAPLTFPSKIFCTGANYFAHAAEMGTQRPDPEQPPFFFLKAPTTTVVGPDADIYVDDVAGSRIDWEGELAVVIGRRCANVASEDAMSVIAGYLVADDLSARGRFARPDAVAPPFAWDWTSMKSLDGFCPIGPGIVPVWQVDDPQALRIRLAVNGQMKQDDTTADMVVKIPQIVAAASRIATLEPGDLILTGTPAGVGAPQGDFLQPGDEVVVTIEGVGSIRHRIHERS